MTSAPATAPCPVLVEPPGFANRLGAMCEDFLALWAATPSNVPELGPRVGFRRQFSNARAAARLIDDVAAEIEWLPERESERRAWRNALRNRIQYFGQERLGWPKGYRRLLFGDAFYDASVAFAREARAFDPRFTLAQLGQALRNVWIGNSLQMLLDLPVQLRPGLFAYSMLYPVTDNWLDDPNVSSDLKRAFNERLGRRLAGLPVRPADEREAAVGRLVERIEQEFPRGRFASVYASLLAICSGQSRSLDQHGGTDLTDTQLLSISFAKGGSSVLTDLYLVAGVAGPSEERFAFGYGVFLQLLDDLQDVEADLAAGHETLFTRAVRRGPIDEPTARLARFIDIVLASQRLFDGPEFADRLDLISRNCRALLAASVAEYPKRFSRRFRRHLARQWPVSFRSQRRLRRRALKRWKQSSSRLRGSAFAEIAGLQKVKSAKGRNARKVENSAGESMVHRMHDAVAVDKTAEDLKARTRRFAVAILKFVDTLPRTPAGDTIARQLARAGTGVAGNYRSACRARSHTEFTARMLTCSRRHGSQVSICRCRRFSKTDATRLRPVLS